MRVTIIIPTVSFERLPLLMQEIRSIKAGTYEDFHIVIVVDGNLELYRKLMKKLPPHKITVVLNEERKGWVATQNWAMKEFDSDYYIYSADDITFPPDCIKCAVEAMQQYFPDGFGVISLSKKHKATFGLFGRKFAEHFPERQVHCPDFTHYGSDRELSAFALERGIFAYPPEVIKNRVKHYRRNNDETWRIVQKVINIDGAMHGKRGKKGYKWGIDFNLITRK